MKSTTTFIAKSILVGLFSLPFLNFAQDQNVEWSELQKMTGKYPVFYPQEGNNFFGTVHVGGALLGSDYIVHYTNFNQNAKELLKVRLEKGVTRVEGQAVINNKLVVFASREENDVQHLYYQNFNDMCEAEGAPQEIASYNNEKGKKRSTFNITLSKNKEFFCIQYAVPGKKQDTRRMGYKILTKEFETVDEGEYDTEYINGEESVREIFLTNTGHMYLGSKIYETNKKGLAKRTGEFNDYVIYRVKGDEMTQLNLGRSFLNEDQYYSFINFQVDDKDILTFTGLYSDSKYGVGGAFMIKVDFESQEHLVESQNPFEKDFITATWSNRAKAKADKKEAKGKGSPNLYSYELNEMQVMEDGSLVVALEQYYVVVTSTTDAKGNTTYTYHYYYNDIILYKVNAEGEFDWVKRVRKYQHSVNDGGYFSSFSGYFDKDQYVFFFNDNIMNYDEAGNYLKEENDKAASSKVSKKKNCVAKVTVDLSSGDIQRKLYSKRSETDAICVPKRFALDENNSTLMMYFQIKKKEKFGMLRY